MKKSGVKAAIVGCGMISEVYLKNLCGDNRLFHSVDVRACCDLNAQAAKRRAEPFGLKVMTLDEICASDEIEMVINLTNPGAHYKVIRQLLLAGKHVYTEKILCIRLEDARELVDIADKKGVYLGVAPDTFLGSSVQTARQIVDSGLIGDVTSCHASVNRDYDLMPELISYVSGEGGGIGFDVGIYYMTALLSILGPVNRVSGIARTRNPERRHIMVRRDNFEESYQVKSENLMVGTMEFASGVVGTIHFNSESIMNEQAQLILYGTQGILFMGNPDHFGDEVRLLRKGQTEPVAIPANFGYSQNSRGLGAAEMAWAILMKRKNRANKEMALNALEALHGMVISDREQRVYTLQSSFERVPPLRQGYLDGGYYDSDPEVSLVY